MGFSFRCEFDGTFYATPVFLGRRAAKTVPPFCTRGDLANRMNAFGLEIRRIREAPALPLLRFFLALALLAAALPSPAEEIPLALDAAVRSAVEKNLDLRVEKSFRAGARHELAILAEAFNVTNEDNARLIDDGFVGSAPGPNFGEVRVPLSGREIQLGVRWRMGG